MQIWTSGKGSGKGKQLKQNINTAQKETDVAE